MAAASRHLCWPLPALGCPKPTSKVLNVKLSPLCPPTKFFLRYQRKGYITANSLPLSLSSVFPQTEFTLQKQNPPPPSDDRTFHIQSYFHIRSESPHHAKDIHDGASRGACRRAQEEGQFDVSNRLQNSPSAAIECGNNDADYDYQGCLGCRGQGR